MLAPAEDARVHYIENRTWDELAVGDAAELARTLQNDDVERLASLIAAAIATELPGPGTVPLDQTLHFRKPVGAGDTITVRIAVK
jgi:hypothetical protein